MPEGPSGYPRELTGYTPEGGICTGCAAVAGVGAGACAK